jgi:hypothetical protein
MGKLFVKKPHNAMRTDNIAHHNVICQDDFNTTHGIGAEKAKEKLLRELPRTPKSLKQEVMGNPLVNPIIRNYKKS